MLKIMCADMEIKVVNGHNPKRFYWILYVAFTGVYVFVCSGFLNFVASSVYALSCI